MNEQLLTRIDGLVGELCGLLDQVEAEGNPTRSPTISTAVRAVAQAALVRMAYPPSFVELLKEKDAEILRLKTRLGEPA